MPGRLGSLSREVRWRVAAWGRSPGLVVGLVWYSSSLILLAILSITLQGRIPGGESYVGVVYGGALVGGEVIGIAMSKGLESRSSRPAFTQYAFRRILRAKNLVDLQDRAGDALRSLGCLLQNRIASADWEAVVLRSIREDSTLPAAEQPETFDQVARVLRMKVQDRALGDSPPWRSVDAMVEEFVRALDGPDLARVRELVHGHLREAGPSFRARVLQRDVGFLEKHPLARDVLIYVGGPVAAAVIFVLFR